MRQGLGIFAFAMTSSRLWGPLSLQSREYRVSLTPKVEQPGREADHSPTYSAEVKNAWLYTSISPPVLMAWCLNNRYILMVWYLVTNMDFTLPAYWIGSSVVIKHVHAFAARPMTSASYCAVEQPTSNFGDVWLDWSIIQLFNDNYQLPILCSVERDGKIIMSGVRKDLEGSSRVLFQDIFSAFIKLAS
jgi:hypothetical protein